MTEQERVDEFKNLLRLLEKMPGGLDFRRKICGKIGVKKTIEVERPLHIDEIEKIDQITKEDVEKYLKNKIKEQPSRNTNHLRDQSNRKLIFKRMLDIVKKKKENKLSDDEEILLIKLVEGVNQIISTNNKKIPNLENKTRLIELNMVLVTAVVDESSEENEENEENNNTSLRSAEEEKKVYDELNVKSNDLLISNTKQNLTKERINGIKYEPVNVNKNITTVNVNKNITTVNVNKNITTVNVNKNITTVNVNKRLFSFFKVNKHNNKIRIQVDDYNFENITTQNIIDQIADNIIKAKQGSELQNNTQIAKIIKFAIQHGGIGNVHDVDTKWSKKFDKDNNMKNLLERAKTFSKNYQEFALKSGMLTGRKTNVGMRLKRIPAELVDEIMKRVEGRENMMKNNSVYGNIKVESLRQQQLRQQQATGLNRSTYSETGLVMNSTHSPRLNTANQTARSFPPSGITATRNSIPNDQTAAPMNNGSYQQAQSASFRVVNTNTLGQQQETSLDTSTYSETGSVMNPTHSTRLNTANQANQTARSFPPSGITATRNSIPNDQTAAPMNNGSYQQAQSASFRVVNTNTLGQQQETSLDTSTYSETGSVMNPTHSTRLNTANQANQTARSFPPSGITATRNSIPNDQTAAPMNNGSYQQAQSASFRVVNTNTLGQQQETSLDTSTYSETGSVMNPTHSTRLNTANQANQTARSFPPSGITATRNSIPNDQTAAPMNNGSYQQAQSASFRVVNTNTLGQQQETSLDTSTYSETGSVMNPTHSTRLNTANLKQPQSVSPFRHQRPKSPPPVPPRRNASGSDSRLQDVYQFPDHIDETDTPLPVPPGQILKISSL